MIFAPSIPCLLAIWQQRVSTNLFDLGITSLWPAGLDRSRSLVGFRAERSLQCGNVPATDALFRGMTPTKSVRRTSWTVRGLWTHLSVIQEWQIKRLFHCCRFRKFQVIHFRVKACVWVSTKTPWLVKLHFSFEVWSGTWMVCAPWALPTGDPIWAWWLKWYEEISDSFTWVSCIRHSR